jgi:2-polyprenyl-3-methyl-5-hydroxy-6-metoxy-1,4-benzoquinol methylase
MYNNQNRESINLDAVAQNFDYSDGINGQMIEYVAHKVIQILQADSEKYGGSLLEMGPAEGRSTEILQKRIPQLEVLDGSSYYVESLRRKFPELLVHHSLFEDFNPTHQYDSILMSHVLEHVEDPQRVLSLAKKWLKPGGLIIASVPNADSIHRIIGTRIGLIKEVTELNDSDLKVGHRRVFTKGQFEKLFNSEGLSIETSNGFFLKFFSNSELESRFKPKQLVQLMSMGEIFQENSAELFLTARKPV